jgi:uncharacterized membrane protein YdjX (TVP38/TMEM64 family)
LLSIKEKWIRFGKKFAATDFLYKKVGRVMRDAWRFAAVVLILILAGILGWLLYAQGILQHDVLTSWVEAAGFWAPLVIIIPMIVAVIIAPIPTVPISVAAGIAFGPVPGFFYAMLGGMIGAAASFWIARQAGRPLVERILRGHVAFCRQCSDRMLFWVVLGARLIPVVSFALVSYASGFTAMSMRAFLLATGLGMIPMTLLYVVVGANLIVGPWLAVTGGLLAIAMIFLFPRLAEHYNLFHLQDVIRTHEDPQC